MTRGPGRPPGGTGVCSKCLERGHNAVNGVCSKSAIAVSLVASGMTPKAAAKQIGAPVATVYSAICRDRQRSAAWPEDEVSF